MAFTDIFGKHKDPRLEKLEEEKNSIIVRKNTAISVSQKEITEIQAKKNALLLNVGQKEYTAWDSKAPTPDCSDLFESIKQLEMETTSKEEKTKEITSRYDEELEILNKEIASIQNELTTMQNEPMTASTRQAAGSNANTKFCTNCGAELIPGNSFCVNCGTKIQ